MNAEYLNEIKAFLDEEGKPRAIPAKRRRQLIVLFAIAERIPAGEEWNERELNAFLMTLHGFGDPAWIRRELCDLGVLERDPYGRRYVRAVDPPTLEEVLAR